MLSVTKRMAMLVGQINADLCKYCQLSLINDGPT